MSLVMTSTTFCNDKRHSKPTLYSSHEYLCLLNVQNVVNMKEERNLYCYSILIDLNLNSHRWLMATILNSLDLDFVTRQTKRIAGVKALKWE